MGASGMTPLFTPAPYPAVPSPGETDGHLPAPVGAQPGAEVPLAPPAPPEVTLPLPKPAGMSMAQPPAERPLAVLSTLSPPSGVPVPGADAGWPGAGRPGAGRPGGRGPDPGRDHNPGPGAGHDWKGDRSMAATPAMAMRRAAWGVAVLLAPLLTGCLTLPHHPWDGEPGPTKVCQVMVAWRNSVGLGPDPINGGRTQPILVGRMYLFDSKIDYPQLAQGGLKVELFDESRGVCNGVPPLENWVFNAEDMPNLMRKDPLGIGYTLLLPWGTFRPDITKIKMRTCYTPTGGLPVYTENVVTLDIGNGVIEDVTSKVPPPAMHPTPPTTPTLPTLPTLPMPIPLPNR